jgi:hypothetical protein
MTTLGGRNREASENESVEAEEGTRKTRTSLEVKS